MIIALPSDVPSSSGTLFNKFGRAPYFVIYDTEKKTTKFITNTSVESSSGAGSHASQILIKEGTNAIITDIIGPKAKKILLSAGISIHEGFKGTIEDNLLKFQTSELKKNK